MPLLPPLVQMAVLDTTKYMAGMKQISGANMAAAAAASSSAKSMTIIGSSLTRHLTLPIVAVGAAVAVMGTRFEASMTKMKSLVGISEKQYKSFSKTIMDFSPKAGRSADELAQALYFITSSGYKGAKAMDILKVSAKAAAAGLGHTQVTADAVTSAMTAYSDSNLTAKQATDTLIAAVREGKAEPEQLAHSIGRVIAPAKIMGISFDQVTGSVAAMTLQGLNAYESVTALRGILRSVQDPSNQAAKKLAAIGYSMETVRNNIKTKGMLPALLELKQQLQSHGIVYTDVFENIRAFNGFTILTEGNLRKTADVFRNTSEAMAGLGNETERAFKKVEKTTEFKLQQSLAALEVAAIKLAPPLMNALNDIAKFVTEIATGFSKLDVSLQNNIVKWAAVAAAIGPVIWILGKLSLAMMRVGAASKVMALASVSGFAPMNRVGTISGYSLGLTRLQKATGSIPGTAAGFDQATGKAIPAKDAVINSRGAFAAKAGASAALGVTTYVGMGYALDKLGVKAGNTRNALQNVTTGIAAGAPFGPWGMAAGAALGGVVTLFQAIGNASSFAAKRIEEDVRALKKLKGEIKEIQGTLNETGNATGETVDTVLKGKKNRKDREQIKQALIDSGVSEAKFNKFLAEGGDVRNIKSLQELGLRTGSANAISGAFSDKDLLKIAQAGLKKRGEAGLKQNETELATTLMSDAAIANRALTKQGLAAGSEAAKKGTYTNIKLSNLVASGMALFKKKASAFTNEADRRVFEDANGGVAGFVMSTLQPALAGMNEGQRNRITRSVSGQLYEQGQLGADGSGLMTSSDKAEKLNKQTYRQSLKAYGILDRESIQARDDLGGFQSNVGGDYRYGESMIAISRLGVRLEAMKGDTGDKHFNRKMKHLVNNTINKIEDSQALSTDPAVIAALDAELARVRTFKQSLTPEGPSQRVAGIGQTGQTVNAGIQADIDRANYFTGKISAFDALNGMPALPAIGAANIRLGGKGQATDNTVKDIIDLQNQGLGLFESGTMSALLKQYTGDSTAGFGKLGVTGDYLKKKDDASPRYKRKRKAQQKEIGLAAEFNQSLLNSLQNATEEEKNTVEFQDLVRRQAEFQDQLYPYGINNNNGKFKGDRLRGSTDLANDFATQAGGTSRAKGAREARLLNKRNFTGVNAQSQGAQDLTNYALGYGTVGGVDASAVSNRKVEKRNEILTAQRSVVRGVFGGTKQGAGLEIPDFTQAAFKGIGKKSKKEITDMKASLQTQMQTISRLRVDPETKTGTRKAEMLLEAYEKVEAKIKRINELKNPNAELPIVPPLPPETPPVAAGLARELAGIGRYGGSTLLTSMNKLPEAGVLVPKGATDIEYALDGVTVLSYTNPPVKVTPAEKKGKGKGTGTGKDEGKDKVDKPTVQTDGVTKAVGVIRTASEKIKDKLNLVDKTNAKPEINLNTKNSMAKAESFLSILNTIQRKQNKINETNLDGTPKKNSYMGGLVRGNTNQPVPMTLHGGEYVLPANVVSAIRHGAISRNVSLAEPKLSNPQISAAGRTSAQTVPSNIDKSVKIEQTNHVTALDPRSVAKDIAYETSWQLSGR